MRVSEEVMQEVDKFNYLRVMISTDGGVGGGSCSYGAGGKKGMDDDG